MAGRYCFCYCYLDSSNKIKSISSLFFEEIYILSLPIIDEFLLSVVVSTVSPVLRVKNSTKSTEISQEYPNSHVNYCSLDVSNKMNSLLCLSHPFL